MKHCAASLRQQSYLCCVVRYWDHFSVCLSVCLSVTCMSYEYAKDFLQLFTLLARPGIWLSFEKKQRWNVWNLFSMGGGLLCRTGMKKLHFSTNISLYLRNDTRYGDSCNGRRIGTCMQSIAVSDFVVMQAVSAVVELVFFITYTLLLMVI